MFLATMNKEHHNNIKVTFIFKFKKGNEISKIEHKEMIVHK